MKPPTARRLQPVRRKHAETHRGLFLVDNKPESPLPSAVAAASIGVIGSGNTGLALACYLSNQQHSVSILTRDQQKVEALSKFKHIGAEGRLEGSFPIQGITADPQEFCATSEIIFVATVATAYRQVVAKLIPHLRPGHQIVLFSSKFGGSLEVSKMIADAGVKGVSVLETDALFACRAQADDYVAIKGIKQWTLFSAPKKSETTRLENLINQFFPDLEAAQNVIQRGITDFGAVAHPVTMLVNMNPIDRKEPFLFYVDGFTEKTVLLLEQMERDFRSVAEAYDTTLIPMHELLKRYYGCEDCCLYNAIRTVPAYQSITAPSTLDHRYISEDVACTLVPLQQLAQKAGVKTPMIDSVVNIATILSGDDLSQSGRTLEKLGWAGKSHKDIIRLINE
ncbi:MAG: NAD/NADP octopine/nopaline dehydrogenase family protein [Candidatus Obscuribacterales bacterium]|nr:NAD/NADP octopine/nopaline dehydrogenase family protein [Candidatus Obscuribacterales bacterium]